MSTVITPARAALNKGTLLTTESHVGITDIDATDIVVSFRSTNQNWSSLGCWGKAGYDIGEFPYFVYYTREVDGFFDLGEYCEGDVSAWRFTTDADRAEAVSWLAFEQWKRSERPWVAGLTAPTPELSVPFSWTPQQ
jgi:hypothetical protein